MPKFTPDQIEFVKKYEALPKDIIAKRLSEIMDEMLSLKEGEDFRVARLMAIELRRWLKTIKLFSKEEQEIKKEDFI